MKKVHQISILIVSFLLVPLWGMAQDIPIRLDFSGISAVENGITVMGAGFGTYPIADVSFGDIPTDNAFDGATDGRGIIVKADPGEGVMIFGQTITTPNAAMIRCSVRADTPSASISLASIDQGEYQFISTITPNNGAFFLNQYKRISSFFIPPSTAFQPIIQIVNTSQTDSLTVYLDNFDIYLLEPGRYYNADFLDGDQNDPETISVLMGNTPLPTPTRKPLPTATPTPFPATPPDIKALQITDVRWNYSSPYLLDFFFSLKDENNHAVVCDPSLFSIQCMENGDSISLLETGAHLAGIPRKPLLCYLVLDYTLSMADPFANGDSDGDGISDAIETMELSAKNFIDQLNIDAQVGIYEFHRDEYPQQVTDFVNDKDFLRNKIDSILTDYVKWFFDTSRCWDAVYEAIQRFPSDNQNDENRIVVFLSDGRDESSHQKPADIIALAKERDVKVFCIGFGAELDPTALDNIAKQTRGAFYNAGTVEEIDQQFQQIIYDLQGQYALRWTTLKRDVEFTPSFQLSLNGKSAVFTSPEKCQALLYSGDVLLGRLRLNPSNIVDGKATVFLRAEYIPRYVRRIRFHLQTSKPFTVDIVSKQDGGLCDGWNLSVTDSATGGKWIEITSPNPDNPFTALPYGAFGLLLKFEFFNLTNINEILTCETGWYIDNSIYTTTGNQRFQIFRESSTYPISTCTPTPTKTNTPTITPTFTYTPVPPTPTFTFTPTFTSTPTYTYTPTYTPTPTSILRGGYQGFLVFSLTYYEPWIINIGDVIEFHLIVDTVGKILNAYDVSISYDSSVLSYVSVRGGSTIGFQGSGARPKVNTNTTGIVQLNDSNNYYLPKPQMYNKCDLAKINFRVIADIKTISQYIKISQQSADYY